MTYALQDETVGLRTGLDTLLTMLTYKRPANSVTELEFIERFLTPLDPYVDGYGNRWIQIGEAPKILWSCHTDTVHHEGGRQGLVHEGTMVRARTKKKATNCLGADDTVGVWLMLEMIKAGVEGRYVFHREEECGGGGSIWVSKQGVELLDGIQFAIALDRAGYTDIITHQGFQRCCSDDFAQSLAAILGNGFKPDDTGVFTDTANYVDLIGECTNLSVGYFRQHGPMECLDIDFALELRDILVNADFTQLVSVRLPGEVDVNDFIYSYKPYGKTYGKTYQSDVFAADNWSSGSRMGRWIKEHPETTADFIEFMGYDIHDLEDWFDKAMR